MKSGQVNWNDYRYAQASGATMTDAGGLPTVTVIASRYNDDPPKVEINGVLQSYFANTSSGRELVGLGGQSSSVQPTTLPVDSLGRVAGAAASQMQRTGVSGFVQGYQQSGTYRSVMEPPRTTAETVGHYAGMTVDSFKNFGLSAVGSADAVRSQQAWAESRYGLAVAHSAAALANAGLTLVGLAPVARVTSLIATEVTAGIRSSFVAESRFLFSSGELAGVERASQSLLTSVGNRRAITWATPGSDAERFLNMRGAEAAAFGADDILLRTNPSKAAVLEEFLHGTQQRLGIVDRLGTRGFGSAETHVKDFMLRHQRMLGLSTEDVRRIQTLRDMGL